MEKKTIHLLDKGDVPAKKARDFKEGDILLLFMYFSKVEKVRETKTQIVFDLLSGSSLDNLDYRSEMKFPKNKYLGYLEESK